MQNNNNNNTDTASTRCMFNNPVTWSGMVGQCKTTFQPSRLSVLLNAYYPTMVYTSTLIIIGRDMLVHVLLLFRLFAVYFVMKKKHNSYADNDLLQFFPLSVSVLCVIEHIHKF